MLLNKQTISKMTNLEFCDFSDNQILSVPECFKSLKKMKKMVLSCNNLSKLPNIFDDMIDLEWLDLYNNKLITCPSLDKNSNIKFLDCEQNNFSVKNKFYRRLLDNLRKELVQNNRLIGRVSIDEPDVLDSNEFNDNSSSSSLYSTTFNSSTSSITDNFIDSNFVEDLWEENNYKVFSEEFDPKDFEQSLKEELSKIKLVNNEKRSVIKNQSIHFGIEHYFRPSDDHSKISYRTNYNLMK
ncbi:uncharacterized protein LOC126904557 isoform X2 [Daktulosphaira vitifoliae]|uniref:uncharacterized protein LOC126904557 isoform X2 n=1 Tax=Daktulosphaira vitifoliae TaxID=58002 RepID=UPI0021A9F85F|nr:uncharacterized protein LOC126904557 isoform X2 [Daktulosphaira vitifoliae]